MSVLVDTSIWVQYFRSGKDLDPLDFLIDENIVVINDLILAELIPFLKIQNQKDVIQALTSVRKLDFLIDWNQIIDFQIKCLKNGINGIGIPDLLIAQNARQNGVEIFSLDKHFSLLAPLLKLKLYGSG